MPNATSRGFKIGYVAESTPGTTPSSALQIIRTTGGGGTAAPASTTSPEIHTDEITDIIRTGMEGSGNIPGVVSMDTLDDFIEAILGGTWASDAVQAGTTKRTFTIEDQYTDAGIYVPWKYCLIEKLAVNFALGSVPTFSVDYVPGVVPTAAATTSAGTGAATAANTNAVMSPVSSIQVAQEGGSGTLLAGAPGITAFGIEIMRPVIKQPQLGTVSMASVDPDQLEVKGTISVYLASKALFDKLLGDTATSFSFTTGGASSDSYNWLMSAAKLLDGGPQQVSKGQPVLQTYNFQASLHASNSSLKVTRS